MISCDNGRGRSTRIIRDRRIRNRKYGSKGSIRAGGILERGII